MKKRFLQWSLFMLLLAALVRWSVVGVLADPPTPPADRPALLLEALGPAGAVPRATGPSAEVSVPFAAAGSATANSQAVEGAFGPLPLPAAASTPQQGEVTCVQLLLNPQLDILELGDGTGRAEPWVIYDPNVYYTTHTYVSAEYSLSVKDADSGDTTPNQDAFAQAFYMPTDLITVTIHYYALVEDADADDEARGNLYTVDQDGYLDQYLGYWNVYSSPPSSWQGTTVTIADPAALNPMMGQRMAIILFNDTDGTEPGERVRFDDVTLTACVTGSPYAVYLPIVLQDFGESVGPVCRPPTENPQDQWNANRGSTEVNAVCNSTLSRLDLADYYTFVPSQTGDHTLYLQNLPAGSEWSAMVFVDQTAYPPPYAPGPTSGDCRIATPGSDDKSVTCSLQGGTGYFIKVSAGASYKDPEASYQMQVAGPGGVSPTPTPTTPAPTGPTAGFWESPTGHEFYVTTDSAHVDNYAIYISVTGCGNYKITHNPLEPITNNQFSFSGSFYASGTFNSTTAASGTDGLDSFYIPGCGYVTGGPVSWDATWQNSSQPAFMPAQVVGPETVEPVAETGEFLTVVPIE